MFNTLATDITPYVFNESLSTVYGWESNEQYYHGDEPPLTTDRSHMFLTVSPGGQSLVIVHDAEGANGDGRTEMRATFTDSTPDFSFKDDPADRYNGEGTNILRTRHVWDSPNTDGWAAGPLTDSWAASVEFTDTYTGTPTIGGLTEWFFYSGNGSSYQLPLEEDRLVVVEAVCRCPADFNGDGTLDIFDVFAFIAAFNNSDPAADFTNDGSFDIFDLFSFITAFNEGCP